MISLIEELRWRDPISGCPMDVLVGSRDPWDKPITGALVIRGSSAGYPIVRGVPRVTPELALVYREWLRPFSLNPPGQLDNFQAGGSVESFGSQWTWDHEPRTQEDLRWRVLERHRLQVSEIVGKSVVDVGAGAGDQSRWILEHGAGNVVSIDLSNAVDVAARKSEGHRNWAVVQADATRLPLEDMAFDFTYCEGVLQHTRDTAIAVAELLRITKANGAGVATHYSAPDRLRLKVQLAIRNMIRRRTRHWSPEAILLASGMMAALAMTPGLRYVVGKTIAVTNERMPGFKPTWSCTYDTYGSHEFQRSLSPHDFLDLFRQQGAPAEFSSGGGILFRRPQDQT